MKHTLHSATGLQPDTSVHIQWLVALPKESQSDYDGAVENYNAVLDKNPSYSLALKRKYTVFQAQVGKEVEAIEALNTYLSCHQGDAVAWYELSHLCMLMGNYRGAT
jgi:predicted Zn-dependent protease